MAKRVNKKRAAKYFDTTLDFISVASSRRRKEKRKGLRDTVIEPDAESPAIEI
jgi:hypothetical protein